VIYVLSFWVELSELKAATGRLVIQLDLFYSHWVSFSPYIYLIVSSEDAAGLRDSIKPALPPDALLFVFCVEKDWAGSDLSAEMTAWLREQHIAI
jgi:hypothetical protein